MTSLDRRYVVTVQKGERSVVSPEPGELPEKDLLVVENGQVVEIVRAVASSLVPPGISRARRIEQLRRARRDSWLTSIAELLRGSGGCQKRLRVLLDIEFKIDRDGSLAVKQVRPFLSNGAACLPLRRFALEVAPGLESVRRVHASFAIRARRTG